MLSLGIGIGASFGGAPAAVATAKPVNTAAPIVSGPQTQGQTLTTSAGSWDQPVTSYAYKWQSSPDGSTWTDITGATASTYSPVPGDIGAYLRSGVLASNGFGSAVAGYAFSSATGVIAAQLSISGAPSTSATVGSSYSFTPSTAGGHTPKTYSIVGQPAWASFSTATGQLTGTPSAPETDSGIVITVTDADGLTASLPSFNITVSAASAGSSLDASDANNSGFLYFTGWL